MGLVWNPILSKTAECYYCGTVFRTKAQHPYEDQVDFMLFSDPDSDSGLSLLVTTGYKAGTILLKLPQEARIKDANKIAISVDWMQENWRRWIYDSDEKEVKWTSCYRVN